MNEAYGEEAAMLDAEKMKKIESFIVKISRITSSVEKEQTKSNQIVTALNYMATSTFFVESNCPIYMKKYFDTLMNIGFEGSASEKIDYIHFNVGMMCKEVIARGFGNNQEFMEVLLYYEGSGLDERERIFKILLNLHDCFDVPVLEEAYTQISKHADIWFSEKEKILEENFKEKTGQVQELITIIDQRKEICDKIATTYNLAGLSHAFQKMLEMKNKEKFYQIIGLVFFGVLILFLPIEIIWFSFFGAKSSWLSQGENINLWVMYSTKIAPFVFIEIILIYFFRVVLLHFNSTKGQIIQLQLRNALCGFIEHHAEFKKDKDVKAFEKFDSIIFSPIVMNQDKIPSTLDGVDSLLKLFSKVKQQGQ